MYRCNICQVVVGPRLSCLRHIVYKTVAKGIGKLRTEHRQIDREIPVCTDCHKELQGLPLHTVIKLRGHRETKFTRTVLKASRTATYRVPILLGEDLE